ncbi:hypothetical protein FXF51_14935 [Nonomuraea sp. PA05]|uniref:SipW-dependent-type signal peptide-containing protein n=1 Tax=Nonomuraea sp. PA05 TaxID=2604466 RepID=UPI0011D83BE0|nr:SipW-dependent-type signal peptide-containing protein [Nonomuraea sp. PA05]TYB67187.1 hypothetical protein FXF51_14935 [Nonomuraea sp. PA05]
MADHDRDAGSRGEEEAPRDPTLSQPTRELPEPGPLKYGEQADQAYAYIPPTKPNPAPWERESSSSFGDYLRRRRTQVMGAGLIGLLVGGLLGGATVAAFNDVAHEGDRYDMFVEEPGWGRHRHWGPELRAPDCYLEEDRGACVLPPYDEIVPDESSDSDYLYPEPTYTG